MIYWLGGLAIPIDLRLRSTLFQQVFSREIGREGGFAKRLQPLETFFESKVISFRLEKMLSAILLFLLSEAAAAAIRFADLCAKYQKSENRAPFWHFPRLPQNPLSHEAVRH